MSEKIKTDAVLCALPDELIHMIHVILRNKGIETTSTSTRTLLIKYEGVETMDAHNREEMLALLQSHAFRGMVTVSSWLPEDEVMARTGWSDVSSIEDTPTVILIERQHFKDIPEMIADFLYEPNHDWIYIPFDIEEFILRAFNMGMLPRK